MHRLLGCVVLLLVGATSARQQDRIIGTGWDASTPTPHLHIADVREKNMPENVSTEAKRVLQQSRVAANVPEFVDQDLLKKVNSLREGFATTMHGPYIIREHVVKTMGAAARSLAVLVGGESEEREGTDTEILFRQESNMLYVSGFDQPGGSIVFATGEGIDGFPLGTAWLFVAKGNPVWQGRTETLQDYVDKYDVDAAFWIEDLEQKLFELAADTIYTLADSGVPVPESATHDTTLLRSALGSARAIKTPVEIEFLKAAADISVDAHLVLMQNVKCGNYESDAESLFRYVGHNYGARFQAYIPIVGAGRNSAALHYVDNDALIPADGLVLVDAGAELGGTRKGGGWAADITRTWPCSGMYTAEQKAIYDVVYAAQEAGRKLSVPGQSMSTASVAANTAICDGLLRLGIFRGADIATLLEKRMYSVFLPHSLGHSVGIDVHDPGSISPFKENMLITIEPGIYFIDSLIDAALQDPTKSIYLNEAEINKYRSIGGVRIEDLYLITDANGPTWISDRLPRTSGEIEDFMKRRGV